VEYLHKMNEIPLGTSVYNLQYQRDLEEDNLGGILGTWGTHPDKEEEDTVDHASGKMVLYLDIHRILQNHKVVVADNQNGLFRRHHMIDPVFQVTHWCLHCQTVWLLHCVEDMSKMLNVKEYLLPSQVLHFAEMVFVRTWKDAAGPENNDSRPAHKGEVAVCRCTLAPVASACTLAAAD
jgi:hypothetical protein